jgi:hypothetical protein
MIPKILFICKQNNYSYGVSTGLLNSCKFVGEELIAQGINYKITSVIDNNCIDREVSLYRPTHVIIEALWVIPKKFEELMELYPNIIWVVRIHSKTPFLAGEGIAFDWIGKYLRMCRSGYDNLFVAGNEKNFTNDLKKVFGENGLVYLPNIYSTDKEFKINYKIKKSYINIGCFGAIRPLKNQMQQAISAIKFADSINKQLHFHMNTSRVEGKGEQELKNIRALFSNHEKHYLVEHPWYNHSSFIKVVKSMDIGMQVSFSESFNIVTADFVKNNVPIIVSHDIDWMNCLYKTSATNSDKIVVALKRAYFLNKFGIQVLNKINLFRHNKKAKTAWIEFL